MNNTSICGHCGQDLQGSEIVYEDERFCCHGCKLVFLTLHSNGLGRFYSLRDKKLSPVKISSLPNSWEYVDHAQFHSTHGLLENETTLKLRFYIEGAHCQACLWILERLPSQFEQVESANFMIENSLLDLRINMTKGDPSKVIAAIESYGYKPHLILDDEKARKLKDEENRKHLIRIGVSFFCAGNIMLLSVSSYAGAEGIFKLWFDWVSVFLSLPIMLYAAVPFYVSSWGAVKNKRFSIDIAIVFALLLGFFVGVYNVVTRTGEVYFDTLAMLIFLLLSSRYLLAAARNKGLSSSEVKSFTSQVIATRLLPDKGVEQVHASLLKAGDLIRIATGSLIAADSKIIKGQSYVNESLLTGESFPIKKSPGDEVLAATLNVGDEIEARVLRSAQDSKAGEMFKRLASNWGKKTHIARIADVFAKYLVMSVSLISLAIALHFFLKGQTGEGVRRALAMIIITCPCALGFNLPIALVLGMRQLAKDGIVVKDDSIIEKITKVKNIFLDKTGTVTSHLGDVKFYWKCEKDEIAANAAALLSLQRKSRHPLAQLTVAAIKNQYGELITQEAQEFAEVELRGPKAKLGGDLFEVYPIDEKGEEELAYSLKKNGQLILNVGVSETLDYKLKSLVQDLISSGKNIFLISGDSKERTRKVANELGIEAYFSRLDPLEKEAMLANCSDTLMIGDGVNDTLALKAADVGIAANGGVDLALLSSDVYFCDQTSVLLGRLIRYSHHLMTVMKSNVILSLVYNVIFVALAMLGHITPLMAAILMPLSSVTMLATTLVLIGEKKLSKMKID